MRAVTTQSEQRTVARPPRPDGRLPQSEQQIVAATVRAVPTRLYGLYIFLLIVEPFARIFSTIRKMEFLNHFLQFITLIT